MKIRLLLLALMTFGLSLAACGDLEEDCSAGETNDEGALCVCTDDTGASCTPDEEDDEDTCACGFEAGNNSTGNNSTGNNSTGNNSNNSNNAGNNSVEAPAYLFLLIEDETVETAGRFPGFDGDGATLRKADGGVYYVSAIDDFNIVDGETAINPDAFKGAPDDNCQADETKFVALGGVGGYLIVSFATADFDGRIENGDSITVHEIGKTSCPNNTYDDEPYTTSVALTLVDAQTGNFKTLGESLGEATIPVSGL